jgi:predicted phage terminase large subunit-like protein
MNPAKNLQLRSSCCTSLLSSIICASVRVSPLPLLMSTMEKKARRAAQAYHEYQADRLIVEDNQGGEMVAFLLGTVDATVPIKRIRASRGKRLRAEPVAALYEQGRVHHVGVYPDLEDQMASFTGDGGEHDDRVDAMVHALTEVMLDTAGPGIW